MSSIIEKFVGAIGSRKRDQDANSFIPRPTDQRGGGVDGHARGRRSLLTELSSEGTHMNARLNSRETGERSQYQVWSVAKDL